MKKTLNVLLITLTSCVILAQESNSSCFTGCCGAKNVKYANETYAQNAAKTFTRDDFQRLGIDDGDLGVISDNAGFASWLVRMRQAGNDTPNPDGITDCCIILKQTPRAMYDIVKNAKYTVSPKYQAATMQELADVVDANQDTPDALEYFAFRSTFGEGVQINHLNSLVTKLNGNFAFRSMPQVPEGYSIAALQTYIGREYQGVFTSIENVLSQLDVQKEVGNLINTGINAGTNAINKEIEGIENQTSKVAVIATKDVVSPIIKNAVENAKKTENRHSNLELVMLYCAGCGIKINNVINPMVENLSSKAQLNDLFFEVEGVGKNTEVKRTFDPSVLEDKFNEALCCVGKIGAKVAVSAVTAYVENPVKK